MVERVRKRSALLAAALLLAAAAPAAAASWPPPDTAPRTAPAADARPALLPTASTTEQTVEITQAGYNSVTVPGDAVAVSVSLYGTADVLAGKPGSVATGKATVSPSGKLRPGQVVMVAIDPVSTTFWGSSTEPWLSAASGTTGVTYPPDTQVFPDAATQPGANGGAARAVLVFTIPAGDIGDLPPGADFGPVNAPGAVIRNIPFTSDGAAPLSLTSIVATPPFAVENTGTSCAANTRVPVGGRCSIAVQVAVTARGPLTGTLTITGNMPGGTRTVTLTAVGITIPGPPGTLTAAPGDGEAVLSWMPPADDGGSPVTGYQVYRAGGPQPTPALLTTVSPATLVYTDKGLTLDTAYIYQVRAVNAVGNSEASPGATVTPAKGLAVTTTVLPPALVGQPYTATLQAEGGTEPYRWSAESLPPGFTLDPLTGTLTGTATEPGDHAFTIRVADTSTPAREAEGQLALSVQPAPPSDPTATATPPNAQAARTPSTAGGGSDNGPGMAVWAWALLGAVGLIAAGVAVKRLRARR
ncbi:fibronectin type III domain-containing protein [Yinghuangia sp. YIM S09857]|uniref:fibronectin type III domain-containing protein n=1 Tax=Yinghuangia sp. YIM S09857 TaxID=3436929 RepID=UPI003F52F826